MNQFIEKVAESEVWRRYESAFSDVTGLPLALRPADSQKLAFRGKPRENAFCALMAGNSCTCAACLLAQRSLFAQAVQHATVVSCRMGLNEIAVPIVQGHQTVAFLRTGQVLPEEVGDGALERTSAELKQLGIAHPERQMLEAWRHTPVLTRQRRDGVVYLLETFAGTLTEHLNSIAVMDTHAEPFVVARARNYVEAHASDPLSLHSVATAVNVSTFHLCKTFRDTTGMHFTEFISRVRVEKARKLLLNSNLRISEIAYESGFQSISHFNRMFRRIMRISPTAYREDLQKLRASMPFPVPAKDQADSLLPLSAARPGLNFRAFS